MSPTVLPGKKGLTQSEIDAIRRRGVTLRDADSDMDVQLIQLFNQRLKGFSLTTLLEEMDDHAARFGVAWMERSLELFSKATEANSESFFKILFYGQDTEGEDIVIQRLFLIKHGRVHVYHDLFILPRKMQGKGLAKQVLGSFYRQYKQAGVASIHILANIDVGSYAWARYGFMATDLEEVKTIFNRAVTLVQQGLLAVTWEDLLIVKALIEDYEVNRPAEEAFIMNDLANLPFGKSLLKDTTWHGRLDLENSEQVTIFERYIS